MFRIIYAAPVREKVYPDFKLVIIIRLKCFISDLHPAAYADGNDVKVMKMNVLRSAWKGAKLHLEREHTTPYIWGNPEKFIIGNAALETGFVPNAAETPSKGNNSGYNKVNGTGRIIFIA